MLLEKIDDYINDNADFIILNRATSYYPDLIIHKNDELHFQCYGSMDYAYDIKIKIATDLSIHSSCTCPYEGYGICKHQAASLNQLIQLIKAKKIEKDAFIQQKTASNLALILSHQNGSINKEKLVQINFNTNQYRYGELKIKSVSKTKIKAAFESFVENYDLSIEHFQQSDEIKMTCSCLMHKNCSHKYTFLKEIKQSFGLNYFSPDYKHILKTEILEERGLIGKVGFDEVFELVIDKDGVRVNEKFKNLFSNLQTIFQPKTTTERKDSYKPSIAEKEPLFAMSFCLESDGDKINSIYPIYGKLNKHKTEISSKIKEIDERELANAMYEISTKDSSLLPLAMRVSEYFEQFSFNEYRLETLDSFIQLFRKFIQESGSNLIYLYHNLYNLIKKNLQEIHIVESSISPVLKITTKGKFHLLEFKVKINGKTYLLDSKKLTISPLGILIENQLIPVYNPEILQALIRFKDMSQINIIDEGIQHLKEQIISPYSRIFDINYKGLTEKTTKKKTLQPVKQVYLSEAEEGDYIVFQPIVNYGKHQVSPGSSEKVWLNEEKLVSLKRDDLFELEFLDLMQDLHPEFETNTDYFFIKTQEALVSFWIMDSIEKLKKADVHVFGLAELKGIRYNLNKPSFSIGLSSGTDWFDMSLEIEFGDQKVDLKKLQKSIVKNSNYVELTDGSLGVLPKEWIEKYKKYFKLGQIKKDKIEISNFQFNIIDELYEDLENSPDFLKELHEKKKRLSNLSELREVKPSKKLKADLRSYQKEGLNWMVFLHENKLGGCLADDMGLGKTLQSIAFLQYLKDEVKAKTTAPSLIVAPTSLMFNWIAEFEKFAPNLKHLLFYGSKRDDLKSEFTKVDVILTTYGSLVKDIEFHKTQVYNYIILDESQAIKNPQSQRFKAVRLLKAYNRLALTGTPIENNTFDLYSQFNFLNSGIFGSVKHFRVTFSDAIDKDQDEDTSALLAKMIHPFILRRTKTQVATELPSKTEAIIYCEMGKKQRKVYEDFKQYFREKLKEQIENEGVNRSQMYILQGLTKLRQICNSTALADKEKDYGNYSAKLDELIRHLIEKVNAHKVLVFSQFVGMLHLVKERLIEEQINFEYLDGQTRNRQEKVNNFQQNDEVRVFLISLKAGGTGLNLTEADYVYLIDPWWNPAVESQAIDRCYRIGQDKKVMAYRMICKDSIEEKITALQDRKKTVAAEVIRTDVEKKSFNQKDVALFFGK